MKQTTKTGGIVLTKIDGIISEVHSEFHIDELFKIIHFMRYKLSDDNPNKDLMVAMKKMSSIESFKKK